MLGNGRLEVEVYFEDEKKKMLAHIRGTMRRV